MKKNHNNSSNTEASQITSISLHPALQYFLDNSSQSQSVSHPSSTPAPLQPKPNKKRTNTTVDPITNPDDIQAAKDYFLSQPQRYQSNSTSIRNYALFVTGCNCARRIGDILSFKISDVLNDDYSFKPQIVTVEQKTNKSIKVRINQSVQDALTKYFDSLDTYNLDDYIFRSREGDNKPITTRSAWRIYKNMSKAIGLDKKGINIGAHTPRKTWAYTALKADPTNPDQIVYVSEALNHSNVAVTRRYCGITQEKMDDLFDSINI